ncbi:MAG: lamin tail domain-containing protein [Planctomycetota bacterium]|jgi:hypothetical protein
MYKKAFFSVFLVLVLGVVEGASAVTWTGAGLGYSWCTAENWDSNTVPGPSDVARINPPPEQGPVVNCNVTVGSIEGPKWSSNSNQVMDVTGGTIVVNGQWRWANGGSGTATVYISGDPNITIDGVWRASDSGSDYAVFNIGGGSISCDWFRIGDDGGGELNISGGTVDVAGVVDFTGRKGNAITFNMTGGELNVGDALQAPGNAGGAGAVTINLDGGVVTCGAFTHAGVSYSMDITGGRLIVSGDVRDEILADVNAGYITAYGGAADVIVEYDGAGDETTVSAVSGVSFETAASAGLETVDPAVLTVKLHNPPGSNTVTVNYEATGGTATPGIDYYLASGTLTFDPGQSSKPIEIFIFGDGFSEEDETIEVTLSGPVNAVLGAITVHTYTILDLSPAVGFDTSSSQGRENVSPGRIPVSLSWVWTETVTVDYNVTGGAADGNGVDYVLAAGALEFEPDEVTEYIEIVIVADDLDEDPDETIEITLSNPSNAKLGETTEHTFTILPPLVSLCPKGDLDGDCDVDANDLRLFGLQWLDPPSSCFGFDCADLDSLNGVDMSDFALLAGNWDEYVCPVVINEFMASNGDTLWDPCEPDESPDWIELYNAGPLALDLGGMYLTDNLSNPTRWRIPDGVSIEAGGYLVFFADDDDEQGSLHTNFKLQAADEDVGLFGADGSTLIDGITFRDQVSDISYGRYPDSSNNLRFFATATPGSENVGAYDGEVADTKFSHQRGFYESPFTLSITSDTNGAEIHYTLDGSEPNEFVAGATYLYTGPIGINQTTTLRAAAFKPGYLPTNVDSQTYIFLGDVLTQPTMDPCAVSTYGSSVVADALKSVPTLSIVIDPGDFAIIKDDAKPEFPISVELIYPDSNGPDGFQVNSGFSIHSHIKQKQAYRLVFKSEFGVSKLEYPFFESAAVNAESAVDVFDRIVLRSPGNVHATFVGDIWAAQSQIAMCGIGSHSTQVHLYINGRYEGLYNPKERPDAWFTSAYLGGDFEDYLGTNHGLERCCGGGCPIILNSPCHLSGDYTRFDQMMNMAYERDLEDPNKYAQFMALCDVAEFADYTILFWESGFGDNMDNNWYAGMRNEPPGGFMMFMWDAEYVFMNEGGPPGNEDPWVPPYYFNSGWVISDIWRALFENADFRMTFVDRVYKHCFNGGALTDENAQGRWDALTDQISEAGIAEIVRWADKVPSSPARLMPVMPPVTVDMTGHVNIFINALRNWSHGSYPGIKLYPDFDPPVFNQHGGHVGVGFGLTMTDPCGAGTIYYTLDGNDPREAVTGNPVGTEYTGAVTLNQSRHVKARVFDDPNWSALNEAVFAVGPVAENLRITEIMYHPNETGDPNTEFIELKNIGVDPINLNLVSFTDGIDFSFPSVIVSPGQHVVVVKDQSAFMSRYPGFSGSMAGEYVGSLRNGGEWLKLEDAVGQVIHEFEYKDGWRSITDGDGFSLTIIDPTNSDPNRWGEKDSWRPSVYLGGSPGMDDSGILPNPGAVVINEVMSHSHLLPDWIELYNTTAGAIDIGGWFLSDNDDNEPNLTKYRIADGTTIGPCGFLVFYEDVNFADLNDPGCNVPFAFSENGEEVVLSSYRDANGHLTGYRQVEDFGASESDVSFGRYYKSSTDNYNFVAMDHNTPGTSNAYPKVGPVVMNEIMYHPNWPTASPYNNERFEYIELYNMSGSDVNLYDEEGNRWKFTDGIDFTFGTDANIPGGGYLLVVKDPVAFDWRYGPVPGVQVLGPYDGRLSNSGEKVELSQPGDVDEFGKRYYIRVDRVSYSDGFHPDDCPGGVDLWPTEADGGGKSLSRIFGQYYGNDPNNWQAASPTPGTINP